MAKSDFASLFRIMHLLILILALTGNSHGQDAAKEVQDPGWPRVLEKDGQKVTIYQPQVDSWDSFLKINARSAVAVILKDQEKPAYGVIELQADTKVDPDTRLVLINNPKREIRFPNLPAADADKMKAVVTDALPNRQSIEVALDRLLAYMDQQESGQREVKVNMDPPAIFFSSKPAILLLFRGAPEFKPISGTPLMFAVNSNWDVLMDTAQSNYYLLNKDSWLMTSDPLKGPWQAVNTLPASFSKLPATEEWADVRAAIPAKPASSSAPAVFASDKPAEIILTDGEPKFSPIAGTMLMYISNTESPVFLCNSDNRYYFLVAGRWFRAQALSGPWESATAVLPAEFAKIPADSPRAFVLTSVPKTDAAEDAVLLASVPRKATVNRKEAKLDVAYAGEPTFATIKGTQVEAAVNTPEDVFEVQGQYYCCQDGVWFMATKPEGPWVLCDDVPDEIYTIPASHHKHNVTYVEVYDSSPDVVEVGYTGGYTGEYVTNGLLVYGAGLALSYAMANQWYDHWDDRWDNWFDYQCHAPVYSYGMGAVYNPYHGGYYAGYGAVARPYGGAAYAYGPYRGAARTAYYNPSTGVYSRGAYRYGPAGSTHARAAYNPWTDTAAARVGGSNVYGSWGRTAVTRDDEWIRGGHRTTPVGTTGWVQTSEGGEAIGTTRGVNKFVGKSESGDVYAGRDGNVYRKDDGEWQKWDDGDWNNVEKPDRPEQRSERASLQDRPQERAQERPGSKGQGTAQPWSGQATGSSQRPARTESGLTASPSQLQSRAESRGTASRAQQPARTDSGQVARPSQQPIRSETGQLARPSQQPARTGTGQMTRPAQQPVSNVSNVRGDLNYNYQARQSGSARANEYQRARTSSSPSQSYRPSSSGSNYSRPSSSSRSNYSRPSSGSRSSYSRPSSSSSRGSYSRGSSGGSRSGGRSGGGGRGGRR